MDPFANSNNETGSKFTITGKSYPFATIDITITPDNLNKTVKADKNGLWKFTIPAALTTGQKQMKVVATTSDGGVNTVTLPFRVVKTSSFGFINWILLILLIVGAYVYIKRKIDKSRYIPPKPTGGSTTLPTLTQEKIGSPPSLGNLPPKSERSANKTTLPTEDTDHPVT